jgi:hypothetical protein
MSRACARSANASGAESTDSFLLNRRSMTRFDVLKENQAKAAYRWCSAKTVD